MTKTARNTAAAAEDSFHKHYATIWGSDRWKTSLYPALVRNTKYTAVPNRYAPSEEFWKAVDAAQIPREELERLELPDVGGAIQSPQFGPLCYTHKTNDDCHFPPPKAASSGLLTHWNLDAASALVASLLNAQPGERILDLCAAPGGTLSTLISRRK